jgi:hypothetical protein
MLFSMKKLELSSLRFAYAVHVAAYFSTNSFNCFSSSSSRLKTLFVIILLQLVRLFKNLRLVLALAKYHSVSLIPNPHLMSTMKVS